MEELIERLKSASTADRELDQAIHIALEGNTVVPAYTGSLDAARQTVPAGIYWMVGLGKRSEAEPLGGAATFRPMEDDPMTIGEHAEPAIALCIAGLKARMPTYRAAPSLRG